MQFIVHDRRTVERDIIARTPHILVSIRDPDKQPVRPRRNAALREALFLDFHDAEPVQGFRLPPDIRLMQPTDAVRIWEFVQRHRDGIDTIVCHCEQGMSRSPAVAIALAEALGGDAEGILAESQPNQYVYELLSETIQHLTEKGANQRP